MTITHGFELQREENITEAHAEARLYRHVKTGAELLSIGVNDENKVFGITFRTPPRDSTGLPHILEHSVLCGSRKYPVKEPFVELLKGSLNTFLNAFTYPDKTCYPVASQNLNDFYNLVDVYLDAVFFPRLTPFVFQQEGWRYELNNSDDPLYIKGVVYNEMKGAYSSPDNILSELSLQSLFPDTPYGYDSGGDPKKIPELTFEEFLNFHKNNYHPSNSRIYFYGDDPVEERLRRVNEIIQEFEAIQTDSKIGLQPVFRQPKLVTKTFMVGDESGARENGYVTINWLLAETTDIKTNFALSILNYILLGMSASPLRKALIDSGLGEDIAGGGLDNELRQMFFSTGLKGVKTEMMNRVEPLALKTLHGLVQKGIDPEIVDAALNTIEFRLRENNTAHFPRGLALMLRSLTTWLYDSDPLALLAFEAPLEAIKSELKSNKTFFETLINQFFLNNRHKTTLYLTPDPDLREKEEKKEKRRLAKIKAAMTPKETDQIIRNTRELERIQTVPDTREALATIPALKLGDLDKQNPVIPMEIMEPQIMSHDIFSNDIIYLDVGLDLHALPAEYLPYVPLFGRALVAIGTEKEDFVSLSKRISRKTGGIFPQIFTSAVANRTGCQAMLFMRGKALGSQAGELFDIMHEILLCPRLDNPERFKQILLEEKARQEQKIVPGGHQFVDLRIRSHFSEAGFAAEQMHGISYLFFLRKLISRIDSDWPAIFSVLDDLRVRIVKKGGAFLNLTSDQKNIDRVTGSLKNLLEALPETPVDRMEWSPGRDAPVEGLTIPAQVNFVGKGQNIYRDGYHFHGSALVITKYIRNTWLWDKIRVQGGAYGAFCSLDRLSGVLTLVSYRDPNITKTLKTFDETAQFLNKIDLEDEALSKGIIGAIGNLDTDLLPDAKGFVSLIRFLTGDTAQSRQKMRDELLSATRSHFREFAQVFEEVKKNGIVKALGAGDAIQRSIGDGAEDLRIVKVL
jgi:Zn-dependent M16 (insulinase) family peptidase